MDAYDLMASLEAITRWTHVFAAILWVGQTYLFHLIERKMRPTSEPAVEGRMWMLHGGGYFEVEKRAFSASMPENLVWFKWEAAVTWISGVLLLGLTYHAGGLLTDPDQNVGLAAAVGFGVLIAGWVVYDALVRTRVAQNIMVFGGATIVLLCALHLGLLQVMSGRAAFIHVGATIGTIMAANVWMRILPAQRKMLAAVEAGEDPDPSVASLGPIRSRHNSMMAAPLVLIMVSNHYPTITYGNNAATFILAGMLIVGWVLARHVLGSDAARST